MTTLSLAQDVSVFNRRPKIVDHKYGILVTGGGSTYLMDDINDFRLPSNDHRVRGNSEDAQMGISYGLALLYRSHEKFRWTIGYTKLGDDRAYSSWAGAQGTAVEYEQKVSGSEVYLMGSYLWYVTDWLHFHLGAGPSIVTGHLDRSYTASTDNNFDNAKGRAFGLRALFGLEVMFAKNLALHLAGGARFANVPELNYEDRYGNTVSAKWDPNPMKMAADFTGAFAEAGLRFYFEPATKFWKL